MPSLSHISVPPLRVSASTEKDRHEDGQPLMGSFNFMPQHAPSKCPLMPSTGQLVTRGQLHWQGQVSDATEHSQGLGLMPATWQQPNSNLFELTHLRPCQEANQPVLINSTVTTAGTSKLDIWKMTSMNSTTPCDKFATLTVNFDNSGIRLWIQKFGFGCQGRPSHNRSA